MMATFYLLMIFVAVFLFAFAALDTLFVSEDEGRG